MQAFLIWLIQSLADHYSSGKLSIVFPACWFLWHLICSCLNLTGNICYSRHDGVLARAGTTPCVIEQLPGVLAGSWIYFSLLPGAIINFNFNRAQGSAVIHHKAGDIVIKTIAGHSNNGRLKLNTRDRAFFPAFFSANITFAEGDIVASHETAHVATVLNMNLVQPFHIGNTIPTGNHHT